MRTHILLAGIVLAGSGAAFGAVDRELLALVPPGARFVAEIDVTKARMSDFGQYLMRRAGSDNAGYERLIQETGFDPRRDLQDVMIASTGTRPARQADSQNVLVLARGTFDVARLETLAKAKNAEIEQYGRVDLIVKKDGNRRTAVAFPETGIAVLGDPATVREVIDHRASPSVLDARLTKEIELASNENDIWFASVVSGAFLGRQLESATPQQKSGAGPQFSKSQALESIRVSRGGVALGDTVKLTFDAETRSPQDATSVADVVRFVSSMLQTQRQNDPRAAILASALDGMELKTEGSNVHVSIALPEKSLEQLAREYPNASGQAN